MSGPIAEVERRYLEHRVELAPDRRIRGYAIVFNSRSVDLGGFVEVIDPRAVDRSLRDAADVRALVDHDTAKVLGRTKSGTLSLRKDHRGLGIEIAPPRTSYADDLLASMERGDVDGMSFAFRVVGDDWKMEDGVPTRYVLDMQIREVSVVTFPAYQATEAGVATRSLETFLHQQRNRVAWLRKVHQTRLARS